MLSFGFVVAAFVAGVVLADKVKAKYVELRDKVLAKLPYNPFG